MKAEPKEDKEDGKGKTSTSEHLAEMVGMNNNDRKVKEEMGDASDIGRHLTYLPIAPLSHRAPYWIG